MGVIRKNDMADAAPIKPPPKTKNLKFVRADFPYEAKEDDELSFAEGDLLMIIDNFDQDPAWWIARFKGKEGLVPVDYFTKSDGDINPIHDACKRGNLELLEECLLNKVPANAKDKAGNTGLHWACRGGHADCVARLLQLGPQLNLDTRNRLGDTPLHLAAQKGSKACIELLLSTKKIDVLQTNGEGRKAYDLAGSLEAKASLKQWMPRTMSFEEYEASDEEPAED